MEKLRLEEPEQKATLSDKLKDGVKSLFSIFKKKDEGIKFKTSEEALGEIYKLMVERDSDRKLDHQEEVKQLKTKDKENEKRNRELIKALTGLKKKPRPKRKVKEKEKEVKPEEKKVEPPKKEEVPAKPEVKPAEAPKPPPKAEPVKPPEVKPPPKAEPIKPKVEITKPPKIDAKPALPPMKKTIISAAVGASLATTAAGVIAKEEGVSKDKKTGQVAAYWDPPGQKKLVSIGYGHQIKEDEYKQGFIMAGDDKINITGDRGIDTRMSMDQAKKLLSVDIPKYENAAKKPLGDSWEKLSDEQKTALISYAYNTGSTTSLVKQGLKDAIDSGNMKLAADIIREKGIRTAKGEFMPELDKRRRREADMFESGIKKQETTNIIPNTNKVEQASKENQQLNMQADMNANKAKTTVNNFQTNVSSPQQQTPQQKDVDDRPAILRKG